MSTNREKVEAQARIYMQERHAVGPAELEALLSANTRPAPAQAGEGKLPPNLVAWRGECAKRDEHGTVFDSDIVSLIDRLEAALSTPPPDARLREAVELAEQAAEMKFGSQWRLALDADGGWGPWIRRVQALQSAPAPSEEE